VIVWLVFAAVCTWAGIQELYTTAANRTPASATCRDYSSAKSEATWLRLQECVLDTAGFAYRTRNDEVAELFFPLRAAGEGADQPVRILLATQDPALLAFFRQAITTAKTNTTQQPVPLPTNPPSKVRANTFEGLVRFGIKLSKNEVTQLEQLKMNLAPGFVILEDAREPHAGLGIFLLVIPWVAWLLTAVVRRIHGRTRKTASNLQLR
jgi:hypothetical protein